MVEPREEREAFELIGGDMETHQRAEGAWRGEEE